MPVRGVTAPAESGVLLVDKPSGPTSHAIVASIRRGLPRGTRVGHAGTLDPFATGLLLVLVGRATRIQRLLLGLPKRYEVLARLGWSSDTGDRDGTLTETGRFPSEPLTLPRGALMQTPPAFSAVKVGGRRAYALARAGRPVELTPRAIEVTEFRLDRREGDRAWFTIACSSGTYVRSLIAELGDAYCEELRRTEIGPFSVTDAGGELLPITTALAGIVPQIALSAEDADRLGHGQRPDAPAGVSGELLCSDPDGTPVALADVVAGRLVSRVGFRP